MTARGNKLMAALTGETVSEEAETKEGKKYDWRRDPFEAGGVWHHLAAIREMDGTYYVVVTTPTRGKSGRAGLLTRSDGSLFIVDKPAEFSGSGDSLDVALATLARQGRYPARESQSAPRQPAAKSS